MIAEAALRQDAEPAIAARVAGAVWEQSSQFSVEWHYHKDLPHGRVNRAISRMKLDAWVESLSWSDGNDSDSTNAFPVLSGSLTLRQPNAKQGGRIPTLPPNNAKIVCFVEAEGKRVLLWEMRATKRSFKDDGSITYDLIDQMKWVAISRGNFRFTSEGKGPHRHGWTAHEIAEYVCERYKIPHQTVTVKGKKHPALMQGSYRIVKLAMNKVSPIAVIREAYRQEQLRSGIRHVVRWDYQHNRLVVEPMTTHRTLWEFEHQIENDTFETTTRDDFCTALRGRWSKPGTQTITTKSKGKSGAGLVVRGKCSQFGGSGDAMNQGTASGKPDTARGIAIYNQATLNGYWRCVWPNGKVTVEQQIDIGPDFGRTGRLIDVTIPALQAAGYTASNFPTDSIMRVEYLGKGKGAASQAKKSKQVAYAKHYLHVVADRRAVQKFGYIEGLVEFHAQDKAEAKRMVQRSLARRVGPIRTLTFDHPGIWRVRRGDPIKVTLPEQGFHKHRAWVQGVTHTVTDNYVMEVVASFSNPMDPTTIQKERDAAARLRQREAKGRQKRVRGKKK